MDSVLRFGAKRDHTYRHKKFKKYILTLFFLSVPLSVAVKNTDKIFLLIYYINIDRYKLYNIPGVMITNIFKSIFHFLEWDRTHNLYRLQLHTCTPASRLVSTGNDYI